MKPYKRLDVLVSTVLSLLAFLILAGGFVLAVHSLTNPPKSNLASKPEASPTTATPPAGMLLGLGDSLTRGIGDSQGQGYFGIVKEELSKSSGGSFSAVNLAVQGSTSEDLLRQVREKRVKQLVKEAGKIVITIGGNDLFRSSGRLARIDEQEAEKARLRYRENLSAILSELRSSNPQAPVFLLGLYNPFGDVADAETSSRLVASWNHTMNEVASRFEKVVVVPTHDLFQLNPGAYLYTDHFHPNRPGYERMADRLLQVLESPSAEVKR
ncbi:GDSL-type esterase/lipase family protein [Staphylospora marina]|uniref:GDSL-type esterase/lipase family protein n=1 Tax=Staphylospora marina TaxID=2490858 RepID=UPI000F5B9A20|nr:GDSL-type esterase/lipase family protein [Staphylospora marina]